MGLKEELENDLRNTIEAAKERGYIPTYFLRMLDQNGGLETAKKLLLDDKPQTGLFELYELDLLRESVEAVVLQKKYSSLFTDVEKQEAYKRLADLGFFVEQEKSDEN